MIALCRKSNSSLYKYFLFTLSQVVENLRVTREKNYCRPLVVIGVRLRTAISLAVAPFSPYNRRRFERLYRYAVRAIINRFRIGNELRCVVRAQIYNSDLFFRKSLRLAFPTCTAVVFLTIFYEFILTETQLFLHLTILTALCFVETVIFARISFIYYFRSAALLYLWRVKH